MPPDRGYRHGTDGHRPLTLTGEIIATLIFVKLLGVTERGLAGAPETRDAILERIVEERGHISFNRMQMGAAELAQTRVLLPVAARILSRALPELAALGAYPADVLSELPLLTDSRIAGVRLGSRVRCLSVGEGSAVAVLRRIAPPAPPSFSRPRPSSRRRARPASLGSSCAAGRSGPSRRR